MRLAHGLPGHGERSGLASRGTAARTLAPPAGGRRRARAVAGARHVASGRGGVAVAVADTVMVLLVVSWPEQIPAGRQLPRLAKSYPLRTVPGQWTLGAVRFCRVTPPQTDLPRWLIQLAKNLGVQASSRPYRFPRGVVLDDPKTS